jgi:hypothetical protein
VNDVTCLLALNRVYKGENMFKIIHKHADPSGLLVAGVAGSNPARGMNVSLLCLCVVLSCVGTSLCDGLITRPEESYRVSVCV